MRPTQRSIALLKKEGYIVAVVEKWVKFPGMCHGIHQDLWGFADIIAFRPASVELEPWARLILLVQTTSGSNADARLDKIRANEYARKWLTVGRIEVHAWAKRGERGKRKLWTCRKIEVN